jgi:hypothetical protein
MTLLAVRRRSDAAGAAAAPTDADETGADRVRSLRRLLVWGAVLVAPLAVAVLVVGGLPDYGRLVTDEQSPMTWLQTVILVVAGVLAGLVAARRWLTGGRLYPWVVLAAGLAWLAVDDRFVIHERLRDEVLAGRIPDLIPWGKPGDIVLVVYAVGGIVLTRSLERDLRHDRAARWAFLAGLVLLGLAVAVDTVDPESLTRSQELAAATVEESLELFGDTAFMLSMALVTVVALAGRDPERATAAPPPP